MKQRSWTVALGFAAMSVIVTHTKLFAQVVSDNSTGTIVTPNGNIFNITGGTTVGGRNLFHSFDQLSVPMQGVANFLNDPNVVNIFSRVTGGKVSEINGILRAQGAANFFLMNPSGIVFGQNASLDVGGSFVATTANAIQFGDRGVFSASNPDSIPVLLTVDPSAFLFSANPADIVNRSTQGLEVREGQNLQLLGGNVQIEGGQLFALGGLLEIGGIATSGTVGIASNGSLVFPDRIRRANVVLTNGFILNLNANNNLISGAVKVQASQLTVTDSATIAVAATGKADAGDLTINADRILIANGGIVFNSTFGGGNAGKLSIHASEIIQLLDGELNAETFSSGNAGEIIAIL